MNDKTAIALLLLIQFGICVYVGVATAGWSWWAIPVAIVSWLFVWAFMLGCFWLAGKLD